MTALNPRSFLRTSAPVLSALLALAILLPSTSMGARADEIPHENYDLVGSNLDVVIALLNSSIGYSELALDSMYYQRMADVDDNLSIVTGVITPAEQLLSQIRNTASSFENLSLLIPPFARFSSQEDSFAAMESSLIASMDQLVSASVLQTLTGEEMIQALDAIARVNSLITNMNGTIDDMLASANDIIDLQVQDERPFSQNNLIPLIERLRDLLNITLEEVNRIIHDEIRWTESEPFLLLWLSASSYYLGEDIRGGGYLFFNGSFASSHLVQIQMDGDNLTDARTGARGGYSFSYPIPLNASWLGPHTVQSYAVTTNGTIYSVPLPMSILLIQTTIHLDATRLVLALPDSTTMTATLRDVRSAAVPNAPCHIIVDDDNTTFTTDASGLFSNVWQAAQLGYGVHTFQAFFDGMLPFAQSESSVVTVVVDVPTDVKVTVFSERFFIQYSIVGNGTLRANASEPLADQHITIFIDGLAVANVTTDENGIFAFSIPASTLTVGTHTLRAAFEDRDPVWRYSQDEVNFKVYSQKHGQYPFLPMIPGWGGGIPETIPYLFFGEYAYFTWLLILALIGIVIRILQMRKRSRVRAADESHMLKRLEEIAGTPEMPAGASGDIMAEPAFEGVQPATPNEKIIWYYQNLLLFLTRKRRIGLRESMTHWEVARVLRALGYPLNHVDRATMLFEKAMYSGTSMTESDTIEMSASFGQIVGKRASGVANAS